MQVSVSITDGGDAADAGRRFAERICAGLGGEPGALVVFAAPSLDHAALLRELRRKAPAAIIVGASSAGEFMNSDRGEGLVCGMGLRGEDVRFAAGIGRQIDCDPAGAARALISTFNGPGDYGFPYRSALILTDALAGHTDVLVDELTIATAGEYQFFGGGAGDNAHFKRTPVFCGVEVLDRAAVALEILSTKPIGVGVRHGWTAASPTFRVTEAAGPRLVSINALPAARVFETYAEETQQKFDRADPIPFFLHNVIGIETGQGHRLRVPLAVLDDGSVLCAAGIPAGAIINFMRASTESAVEAAQHATEAALAALGPHTPRAALFFDCVATRLRMGRDFDRELASVGEKLAGAAVVGCNTHGQIVRSQGQFSGFHNCTAVVAVLPE